MFTQEEYDLEPCRIANGSEESGDAFPIQLNRAICCDSFMCYIQPWHLTSVYLYAFI